MLMVFTRNAQPVTTEVHLLSKPYQGLPLILKLKNCLLGSVQYVYNLNTRTYFVDEKDRPDVSCLLRRLLGYGIE